MRPALNARLRWWLVLALALAACGTEGTLPEADARYVTSAACGRCHGEAYRAWSGSHHDRAMQVAGEQTVLGDFRDAVFEDGRVRWRFYRRAGDFFVHTQGADGVPADFEVVYTFGFEPLQQYLVEQPGGRLQALTVAWDSRAPSEGGGRWFSLQQGQSFPPGDVLHWTGAGNRWNSMCAHCHSTNLQKRFDFAEQRYATSWSEHGVACEACHGPGSLHVAWAEAGAQGAAHGLTIDLVGEAARWVMDPASGIARREPSVRRGQGVQEAVRGRPQLDACSGCHSRRSLLSESATGRYLDRHRPALLEAGLYFPDGQIQDEVYVYGSFLQSRMYRAGVTCSDCHDPHSLALKATGDALCAQCHAPARFAAAAHHHHPEDSPGARCVECHMPARTYMSIDDRRDHGFRIPRPDLSLVTGSPNACNRCHDDESAAWAAEKIARWPGTRSAAREHFGQAIHAGRIGAVDAAVRLIELADAAGQPAIARATAVAMLGSHPSQATAEAIERASEGVSPLVRAAAARAAEWLGSEERVRRVGSLLSDPIRSVRIEAGRVFAGVSTGLLSPPLRRARSHAVAEYRDSQALHLDEPAAHVNLALLLLAQGEPGRAERSYRRAIEVGDYFLPAYANLADLYRQQDRDDEGELLLREALRREPGSAELHHALGLLLVRLGRSPEATRALQRAAELAPANSRFAYVHAVALHSAGQVERALNTLRAASERHPSDRELLQALAAMSRDAGRTLQAREALRRLEALTEGSRGAR